MLFIEGNHTDRAYFAVQLKNRSSDYKILEATDGEEGLILCRSRRFDCVVSALELLDQSGLKVLVNLVPIASRPDMAIAMLTNLLQRGLGEIARQNGPMHVLSNDSCRAKIWMKQSRMQWPMSDGCPRKIGTGSKGQVPF